MFLTTDGTHLLCNQWYAFVQSTTGIGSSSKPVIPSTIYFNHNETEYPYSHKGRKGVCLDLSVETKVFFYMKVNCSFK